MTQIKNNREAVQKLGMLALTLFRGIDLKGIVAACEKALPALPEETQRVVREDLKLLTAAVPLWEMGEKFAAQLVGAPPNPEPSPEPEPEPVDEPAKEG